MDTIKPRKVLTIVSGAMILLSSAFAKSDSSFQASTSDEDQVIGAFASSLSDSSAIRDKVHLKNGTVLVGKVTLVKVDLVEFEEEGTNLKYELGKAEIMVIVLSSGKTLSFPDEGNTPKKETQTQQAIPQPVVIQRESGSSAGLVVLAAVGATLLLLVIIGAAAR